MELLIQGSFTVEAANGFVVPPKVIKLLDQVERTGSLNAAVKELNMSYSYAWNLIHKTNCKLETPVIITRRGGSGGGIAELTKAGQQLLEYCNKLESDFYEFIGQHKMRLNVKE